jgi:hypothetical protein
MAIVAAITMVTAVGCVSPNEIPQFGTIPGTFTIHQVITGVDSNGPVYGLLEGNAFFCWSSTTALKISWVAGTGAGTLVKVSFGVFGGASYPPDFPAYFGPGASLVTDVLAPGCGSIVVLPPAPSYPDPTGQSAVTIGVEAA